MTYVRKTRTEWRLHIHYGQRWEHETSEDSYKDARAQARTYHENCPEYPTRITGPHRVRIETEQTQCQ